MKTCSDCFADPELHSFIESQNVGGVCDVTGKEGKIMDLDNLSDFFSDLLSIFEFNPNSSESLYDIVQRDWNLFVNKEVANRILKEVISESSCTLNPNRVSYIKPIADYINIWQNIKNDLQFKTRYFLNLQHYNYEDPYLTNTFSPDDTLQVNRKLYRARVLPDRVKMFGIDEMGCPPKDIVSAGRANPIGIPYLYLCDDEDTTFYEVRARYKDRIAVGTFVVLKNLRIINLTSKSSIYLSSALDGDFKESVKHKLLRNAVAGDMSKPLSRYDTELEYVPTQFICELCRANGADGICFNSSLHHSGMNYVLFCGNDDTKIKCQDVKIKTIEHVEIRS